MQKLKTPPGDPGKDREESSGCSKAEEGKTQKIVYIYRDYPIEKTVWKIEMVFEKLIKSIS